MLCDVCSTENRSGALFCKECGTELYYDFNCSECGTPLRKDHKYCDACGANQEKKLSNLSKDPYTDPNFESMELDDFMDPTIKTPPVTTEQFEKGELINAVILLSVFAFCGLVIVLLMFYLA